MRQSQAQARIILSTVAILVIGGLAVLGWFVINNTRDETIEEVAAAPVSLEQVPATPFESELDRLGTLTRAQLIANPVGYSFESPQQTYWYPVSEEFGPTIFDGVTSSGFSRTTEGAGLAAIHLYYRSFPVNPEFQTVLDDQITGPSKSVIADSRVSAAEQLTGFDSVAQRTFPVGWDVLSYDENSAEFLIYYGEIESVDLFGRRLRVAWSDNDWKLVASGEAPFRSISDVGVPRDFDLTGAFK